ncbi:response regulator [Flavobacterium stagni]|uniref:Response regulator transcription factor n=1 Tax=Flavobacterium stagni TaxID=2506421 RepID=A0A4Q1K8W9_9FLAO|nr:response regulator transcription factor [Flavobacterium stagni]RXR22171.1 response regulator transcription factor [Flavobacterium stagni]
MIRLALVDDKFFLLKALQEKLDFPDIQIKVSCANGAEMVQYLEKNNNVDLILMDIEMPVMNGIEATAAIKAKWPHIKIVMITVFDTDETIFKAIQSGADGYLLKETNGEKIREAIQDTLQGGAAMSPSIAMKTLRILKNPDAVLVTQTTETIQLSEREVEVLEQISKGLKNKAIAENLFISAATVKKHIENIYRKLQAHNRVELVQKARDNKLI